MSSSLRRSQRGKATSYKQGDCIEIVKNKSVLTGHLMRKIEDSMPSNPVWIVRFEGKLKDQVIPEKSFGRVVTESSTNDFSAASSVPSTAASSSKAQRGRPRSSKNATNPSSDNNSSTGSSMQVAASIEASHAVSIKPKKKIYRKRKQLQQQLDEKSTATSATTAKAAAEEKETKNQHFAAAATLKTGINTRSASNGKRSHATLGISPKQGHKKAKKQNKEEVLKVQYNTGTLFVYKGENPRVVFKWHY